jgi:GT2 family glycosyltransferase
MKIVDYKEIFKEVKPVHLIMPHYKGKYDIIRAFSTIMDRTNYPFILTIIDDASPEEDEGFQFLVNLSVNKPANVNIIFNKENVGVTKNLNYGFSIYPELDCVRLDADIEIQSSMWLDALVMFMKDNKECGVAAPLCCMIDHMTIYSAGQRIIYGPEEKIVHTGNYEKFDMYGESRFGLKEPLEVDTVLGCCAYYRREVIDKLGGIDEKYFGWIEDNDFCLGARKEGYDIFVLPYVSFCHHDHAPKRPSEERKRILEEGEDYFVEKWGFSLYNPEPYWEEIKKRWSNTKLLWRYNNADV